jgi:hypothetical protein
MGDLACACLGLFSLAIVGISPGRGPDASVSCFSLACRRRVLPLPGLNSECGLLRTKKGSPHRPGLGLETGNAASGI